MRVGQNKSKFKFKPFSLKQKKVLTWWREGSPYKGYDGIIADGAIRSGKTIAFILSFVLWSTSTFTGQNFIISGKSIGTLKRNIVGPMLLILRALGIQYVYNRSENFLEFGGNTYYLFGANNEASQDTLQGITAAGWLADEVALQPQSFIEQAFGRCSVEGSKYWHNCNPENPYHYVKVEIIDKAKEKRFFHVHFSLDDNLTLSEKIKERYRRMFSGVWHKRFILGLWVAAEGAIYDMLDENRHVIDDLPTIDLYWLAFDYGPGSVTTAWLLGESREARKIIVVDFWRHDVSKNGSALSDSEVTIKIVQWLDSLDITPDAWIIPHDAQSLALHVNNVRRANPNRIKSVQWADQSPGSVLRGIQGVALLLSMDILLFTRLVQRKGGLGEWQSYVWDSVAQKRGIDQPLKQNDHGPDAARYGLEYIRNVWQKWMRA